MCIDVFEGNIAWQTTASLANDTQVFGIAQGPSCSADNRNRAAWVDERSDDLHALSTCGNAGVIMLAHSGDRRSTQSPTDQLGRIENPPPLRPSGAPPRNQNSYQRLGSMRYLPHGFECCGMLRRHSTVPPAPRCESLPNRSLLLFMCVLLLYGQLWESSQPPIAPRVLDATNE